MAFFTIPIPAETIPFDQQVELDGVSFLLKFRYYYRDGFWRLTIVKGGTVILTNIKLINTLDLLGQYRHLEDLPAGTIIISDQNFMDSDPNDTNFGDSILLMYEDTAA